MRTWGVVGAALVFVACAGSGDADSGAAELGDGSSGSGSTGADGGPSSTAPGTSATTMAPGTSATTSITGDSGSTGPPCEPGTQGCSCRAGMCDDDLDCVADLCEPFVMCVPDRHEPNVDEIAATYLGMIDDSDGSGGTISGVLDHSTDLDWYTYDGDDDFLAVVDPTREIIANGGFRVCKFFECVVGLADTEVTCPADTTEETSPEGRPGCCRVDEGFEAASINCAGVTEDSMAVYIRMDAPDQQCVQYSINYHF